MDRRELILSMSLAQVDDALVLTEISRRAFDSDIYAAVAAKRAAPQAMMTSDGRLMP